MAKLTEDVKKLIGELKVALVATASKSGKPNVSPKGSFRVVDDEHVAFITSKSPRTMANLKENPQVSVILADLSNRKGVRIWGKAKILTSGDLVKTIAAEYAPKNIKVEEVVLVTVDECATL